MQFFSNQFSFLGSVEAGDKQRNDKQFLNGDLNDHILGVVYKDLHAPQAKTDQ